jgi:probable HAF family extracellular repeat protein
MKRLRPLWILAAAFVAASLAAGSSAAAATAAPGFFNLGDLAGGDFLSKASAVSADGSIVVGEGWSTASGEFMEAYRWSAAGGLQGLGFMTSTDTSMNLMGSQAYGVSGDGSVIVGTGFAGRGDPLVGLDAASYQAFRWTVAGGMQGLGFLQGGDTSEALAVSSDGSVIVGMASTATGGLQAFRWTAATGLVALGTLSSGGLFGSRANAVSSDGSVVAGASDVSFGFGAFRWTATDHMKGMGLLPGGQYVSIAIGVSADGSVIVGSGDSAAGYEAFRWTAAGGLKSLGDLPGGSVASEAMAVSADGSIVVGHGTTDAGPEAFIWDVTHGMRNLRQVLVDDYGYNMTGWQLVDATGISADGRTIVGWGANPSGEGESYMIHLPRVITWNGAAGDHWDDPANWTSAAPADDCMIVIPAGSAPPCLYGPSAIHRLDLQGGGLTLCGSGYLLTLGAGGLHSAGADSSTLSPHIALAADNTNTLYPDIGLAADNTWRIDAGGTLCLAGVLYANGHKLTKTGGGALELGQVQGLAALTVEDTGTVQLTPVGGRVLVIGDGTSNSALTLAGGTAPTARLELHNNGMIVRYNSGGTAVMQSIFADVKAGWGTYNPSNRTYAYDGTAGITSSQVAADPTDFAIGVVDNSFTGGGVASRTPPNTFLGQTVLSNDVLVRFTVQGDLDLNGVTNGLDYLAFKYYYSASATHTLTDISWQTGDFNGDGVVNVLDYTMLKYGYSYSSVNGPLASGGVTLLETPTCSRASAAVACDRDITLLDVAANTARTCQVPVWMNPATPVHYISSASYDVTADGAHLYYASNPALYRQDSYGGASTLVVDISRPGTPMYTWKQARSGVVLNGVWVMADGSLLISCCDTGLSDYDGTHEYTRLYRSTDAGATWTESTTARNLNGFIASDACLTKFGNCVAYCDYSAGHYCGYGVWYSGDNGATWTQIFHRWPTYDATWDVPASGGAGYGRAGRHGHGVQFGYGGAGTLYMIYGDGGPILKLTKPNGWNGSDDWTMTILQEGVANEGGFMTSQGLVVTSGASFLFANDGTIKPILRAPSLSGSSANAKFVFGGFATVRGGAEIDGIMFAAGYSMGSNFSASNNEGLYASADGGTSWVAIDRSDFALTSPYRKWQGHLLYRSARNTYTYSIPFPVITMVPAIQCDAGLTNQILSNHDASFVSDDGHTPTTGSWADAIGSARSTCVGTTGGPYNNCCMQINHTGVNSLSFMQVGKGSSPYRLGQPTAGQRITLSFYVKPGAGWIDSAKDGGTSNSLDVRIDGTNITQANCYPSLFGNTGWTRILVEATAGASPTVDDVRIKIAGSNAAILYVSNVMLTYSSSWREDSYQPPLNARANESLSYSLKGLASLWNFSWHWRPEWGNEACLSDLAIASLRADDGTWIDVIWQASSGKFKITDNLGHSALSASALAWRHWDDIQFTLAKSGGDTILSITNPVVGTTTITGTGVTMALPTSLNLGVDGGGTVFSSGEFALPMATINPAGQSMTPLMVLGGGSSSAAVAAVTPTDTLLDRWKKSGGSGLLATGVTAPEALADDPQANLAVWSAMDDAHAVEVPILNVTPMPFAPDAAGIV